MKNKRKILALALAAAMSLSCGNLYTGVLNNNGMILFSAPVLNALAIAAVDTSSMTLEQPTLASDVLPEPVVEAYIGVDGTIAISGAAVTNSVQGPVNVYSGGYTFDSLDPGTAYRVIVVARNISGFSTREIVQSTGTLAPVLNSLNTSTITWNTITLDCPTLSTAGDPLPTVQAYIGVDGTISESGANVSNSIQGPIDVSAAGYTFYGLSNTDYGTFRIIVVAQNAAGYSVQQIVNNLSPLIDSWSSTTSLAANRYLHTSVVYNGYIYVIGGSSGASGLTSVQYAKINSNGTVGGWSSTTSFTSGRVRHASVVNNGYIYIIGGFDNVGGFFNDVQYAKINSDGTVGTWSSTTVFPTARRDHASVVYNGYLYVIGGEYTGPQLLNDVRYAKINSNGSVGAWSSTTSFTTARSSHASVVSNGYVYVIGGYGSSVLNDVQYAKINSDGTVGAWSSTTVFPTARRDHISVVNNGYVYVIGGMYYDYNEIYLNDVQYAKINSDGTVGTWYSTTSFTTGRYLHTSAVSNGYVYVIGGTGDVYYKDVQYGAFK